MPMSTQEGGNASTAGESSEVPAPAGAASETAGGPRAKRVLLRLMDLIGSCFATDGTYLPTAMIPPCGAAGWGPGPGLGPR
jgi:hypothetical protein